MNELYEPVRAWAEYDEYRLFGDYCCGSWHVAVTPTGNGPLVSGGMHDTLSVSLLPEHFGPLRSLRVLLRSGHDFLLVHAWDGEGVEHWQLLTPTNGHDGWNTCVTNWKFVEGQDTEAVSRALAEAQRWLEENEQEATE